MTTVVVILVGAFIAARFAFGWWLGGLLLK